MGGNDLPGDRCATAGLPGQSTDDEGLDAVATRIFHGRCGRIVLTVQAPSIAHTHMLARICAAALEAAVLRMYGERLEKH